MAAAKSDCLYRGAFGGATVTCRARAAGWPELLLFLPRLPSILRYAAATLPNAPTHRTSEDITGQTYRVCDRRRLCGRIQRHQLLFYSVPQGEWIDPDRLSARPRLDTRARGTHQSFSMQGRGEYAMPFLRVDAYEVRSKEQVKELLDAIHRAVLSSFGGPLRDRSTLYREHSYS